MRPYGFLGRKALNVRKTLEGKEVEGGPPHPPWRNEAGAEGGLAGSLKTEPDEGLRVLSEAAPRLCPSYGPQLC